MTVSGQVSRPPLASSYWPLTLQLPEPALLLDFTPTET